MAGVKKAVALSVAIAAGRSRNIKQPSDLAPRASARIARAERLGRTEH